MTVPFTSASTAIARLLSRKNGVGMFMKSAKSSSAIGKYSQVRQSSSIAGIEIPCVGNLVDNTDRDYKHSFRYINYDTQKRCFLGCGDDGSHGNVLSKTHEERRVLGYSPEQVFEVVAAVDLYADFVPWCQRSEIVRDNPDGSFDAELEIGFKFLNESYVSHVESIKPKYIKTAVSESNLFDHLINIWEFNPGPVPGACDLHFLVDFKFQSPLYRQVATVFFTEVATRLVGSFVDRCRVIYGPEVKVLEKSHRGTIERHG